jgi:spermidine synthase
MDGGQAGSAWLLRWSAYVSVLASGVVTMALEMLIGRSLTPYLGGTIYTWGALISVFLIGMTMGYIWGGRLADRFRSLYLVCGLFVASAGLIFLVPALIDEVVNTILDHVEDMRVVALLSCLAFAFLPALTLAAVSPACLRLVLVDTAQSGTVSGRISALATLGSIGGTLVTSFFMIPSFGTHSIYFGLGLISLALAVGVGAIKLAAWRMVRARAFSLLALASLAAIACFNPLGAGSASAQQVQMRVLKDGLVERTDSEYNTIFVEKNGTQLYMAFGYRRNRYIESVLDLADPGALPVTYTRYMSCATLYTGPDISRIALIGLGGGRTISYLLSAIPQAKADVGELDGQVIRLAKKYFNVVEDDRLKIYNRDGRVFLFRTEERYNIIIVDAYRGPFVPFHLTTAEFYKLAKSKLRPGGVVAQNVEPSTLFFDSAWLTMKSVFDNVDAYEADGNIVLIGYDGAALSDDDVKARTAVVQDKFKFRYDLADLIKRRRVKVDVVKGQVLTDDFAPVEMLKTIERHNQRKAE